MALSNTAVPKYYGMFRDAVLRGKIPICREIELEMNRIDELIADPGIYYDDEAVEGWIRYCEGELTLTDGSDLVLLDSFKVWAEQIFGWYYYEERSIYEPNPDGHGGHYVNKWIKKRLINKQYLIVGRGASKSLYESCLQSYFLNIDTSTTYQMTTAPTMKQAEEIMSPIRTSITRSRGPLFSFLTEGSLQNTTGSKANRVKLASTKKGIENFLTGSLLEIRPMSIDKLQGMRPKLATIDEWLSGDVREDVVGAIEQGASKVDDYLIVAVSSEGTVRNGSGDTIKMELMKILKGEYRDIHTSIWWYKLDSVDEVGNPDMWQKANPKAEKKTKVEAEQEIKKQRTDEFRSNAKAMRERISSRLKDLNEALSQRASSKKKAIDERKKSDLDEITAETEKKKQRVEAKKESEIEKLMSVPIPEGLSKAEKSKRIAERNEKIAKLRSDAKSEKDKLSDRSNSDKGDVRNTATNKKQRVTEDTKAERSSNSSNASAERQQVSNDLKTAIAAAREAYKAAKESIDQTYEEIYQREFDRIAAEMPKVSKRKKSKKKSSKKK